MAAFGVPEPYVSALHRAGARPVLITPGDGGTPEEILAPFDALMLIGGGDVDPARYGGDPNEPVYGIEPDRDDLEIGLTRAAARAALPTLAICRGAQLVNVALGGTLIQHLPDLDGLIPHGSPIDGSPVSHDVKVEAGSRVAEAAGAARLTCTSHHHQGIGVVGDGLVPTAWAEDGQIEALESPDRWLVAVVWHPEITAQTDPAQQGLFDSFVRETKANSTDQAPAR